MDFCSYAPADLIEIRTLSHIISPKRVDFFALTGIAGLGIVEVVLFLLRSYCQN